MMIGAVVRRLMEHHPEVPFYTVHDSITTVGEFGELVGRILREEYERAGLRPALKQIGDDCMARKKKTQPEPLEPLVPRFAFGKYKGRTVDEVMRVESILPRLVRGPGRGLRGTQGGDQGASAGSRPCGHPT